MINTNQLDYDNLTELERDLIFNGMMKNDYGDSPDHWVWSWAIYDCGQMEIVKKKQVSGVVSSLVKKELIRTFDGDKRDEYSIQLTKKGIELVKNHLISINDEDVKYY